MTTKDNTQFADKVIETLRKAATEIEEFQVQAALGKAEAEDKYEELKKKFDLFIHDSKFKMKEGKEKMDGVNTKLDELRVQLALGKAESLDAFKAQKKKLLLKLHELEVEIKTNETLNRMYAFVLLEIEKFRVNLEVIEQKFGEGKKESKTSFEKGKKEFNQFIDNFKNKYGKKKETKWEHFQGEISEAFDHLKHAFTKP
ncbi:hypothetical protein C7447_103382 [Tenacibaculum adriaticum]|uniref:Uncharacterized protein n=1 Tax=Tenacibaculum adriaticum TaxID=413713 RepID=A0A5S5DQP2_9FLAO|nr:hypothetical protein [Tenacibaculum adriaticum]TYP98211.1 hypothetical protein C7447_103382 [Tenacibaculum adriaticum]